MLKDGLLRTALSTAGAVPPAAFVVDSLSSTLSRATAQTADPARIAIAEASRMASFIFGSFQMLQRRWLL